MADAYDYYEDGNTGYTGGNQLSPKTSATRAQVATMLMCCDTLEA